MRGKRLSGATGGAPAGRVAGASAANAGRGGSIAGAMPRLISPAPAVAMNCRRLAARVVSDDGSSDDVDGAMESFTRASPARAKVQPTWVLRAKAIILPRIPRIY